MVHDPEGLSLGGTNLETTQRDPNMHSRTPMMRPAQAPKVRAGQFVLVWDNAWLYGFSAVFVVTQDEDECFCFHAKRIVDPIDFKFNKHGVGKEVPLFTSQIIARAYDSLEECLDCSAMSHELEGFLRERARLRKLRPEHRLGGGGVLVQVR